MLYDFHMHSCLSPCGDDEMTPNNIAGMSHIASLGAISLTDHNCTLNLPRIKKCAENFGIKFIPGIEVGTNEDIHVLCYFDKLEICMKFGDCISKKLPPIKNKSNVFGKQLIMDCDDNIIDTVDYLLLNGCNYSLKETVDLCHNMGGIAVYAHIDKNSYSVLSVLGAIPQEINIDGVELYNLKNRKKLIQLGFLSENMPYMTNSDAHYLENIGEKEQHISNFNPLYKLLEKMNFI